MRSKKPTFTYNVAVATARKSNSCICDEFTLDYKNVFLIRPLIHASAVSAFSYFHYSDRNHCKRNVCNCVRNTRTNRIFADAWWSNYRFIVQQHDWSEVTEKLKTQQTHTRNYETISHCSESIDNLRANSNNEEKKKFLLSSNALTIKHVNGSIITIIHRAFFATTLLCVQSLLSPFESWKSRMLFRDDDKNVLIYIHIWIAIIIIYKNNCGARIQTRRMTLDWATTAITNVSAMFTTHCVELGVCRLCSVDCNRVTLVGFYTVTWCMIFRSGTFLYTQRIPQFCCEYDTGENL